MPVVAIILEVGLFLVGVFLYFNTVRPKRKIAYWALIGFFLLIHVMNLLGPAPPSIDAVAWSANAMWIFVVWAWWIEKE